MEENRAPKDATSSAIEETRLVELSPIRQAVERTVSRSKKEIPHFYLTMEIDISSAVELRRKLNQSSKKAKVTINDMVVLAAAKALVKYPALNASYQEGKLKLTPSINIGIVVALKEGIVIPAILQCDKKSLFKIAQESKDLVERAHKGVLKLSELTGGTFSISNLGMYGVESFSAIIFPPQSAMLAVGNIRQVPVVRDGNIAVANMMKVTLSIDHRVADGTQGAQLLAEIKSLLEKLSFLPPQEE